jgi:hypothetical protein
VAQIIASLAELSLHVRDRCIGTADLGLIGEAGNVEPSDRLIQSSPCGRHARLPLLDVLLPHRSLLCETIEDAFLVELVVKLAPQHGHALRGHVHVGFEHQDILPGRCELGFELLDLVLVGPPVELEQGLALLHRNTLFNQHGGDEGRVGQARNKLDGALNDCGVGGVGRDEPQADKEHQEEVEHEK